MRTSKATGKFNLLITLVLSGLISFQALAIEVIAHPELEISQISSSELRRIYTMKKRHWYDKTPIHVYVLPPDSKQHKHFTKRVLQMFPYQLERMWNKLAFSGAGVPPTEVATEDEMIRLVSSTPGSIGYIGQRNIEELNVIYQESGDLYE